MFEKGWSETAKKWLGVQLDPNQAQYTNPGRNGNVITTNAPLDFTNGGAGVAANTNVTVDVSMPSAGAQEYLLDVYNPSAITDLTVKVFQRETLLGGGTRYSYITSLPVPKSQTISGTSIDTWGRLIHGIFAGDNLRLVFSNDTVLTGVQEFTGYMRLREVTN